LDQHDDLVIEIEQPLHCIVIRIGDAQQRANHPGRNVVGNIYRRVDCFASSQPVERVGDDLGNMDGAIPLDIAGGEQLQMKLAELVVFAALAQGNVGAAALHRADDVVGEAVGVGKKGLVFLRLRALVEAVDQPAVRGFVPYGRTVALAQPVVENMRVGRAAQRVAGRAGTFGGDGQFCHV